MAKKKILVIDDEVGFGLSIKFKLEESGNYEVFAENKGSRALAAVKKFKPDLILLDVIIPDVDGGEIAYQLKNDEATKNIPVVFITAIATEKDTGRQDGVIAGHPFITKTADTKQIIDVIERNVSSA